MSTINNGVLDGTRRVGPSVRELGVNGGIAGAPLGVRLRGASQSGPPQVGSWKAGDQVSDRASAAIWVCTASGTPGTWAQSGLPTTTPTSGAVAAPVGNGTAWAWGNLTPALIGSARTATLVVAASNASSKSKGAADYVCTGTSGSSTDSATIQSAIRALNAAGGGRLVLTEGIYWRTTPIYVDGSKITIEAQGDATQFTVAAGATGAAHIIIGSNGAFDGVTYAGGDTAPTSVPTEITLKGLLLQDYQSAGVALAGSASGVICRGSIVHMDQVNVKLTQLEGLRWEGFRQMGTTGAGTAGTLGAAVATTPAWGTSETWTVNMTAPPLRVDSTGTTTTATSTTVGDTHAASGDAGLPVSGTGIPAGATIVSVTPGTGYVISAAATASGNPTLTVGGQFTCIVTPAAGGDYDPEIVNVTAVSGTSWTVQRGWMQTTAKTHASGDSITVLKVTTTFNNVTRNSYIYSPLRSGLLTQQGLDDSEFIACIVNGGSSASAQYTEYGIWAGGSNCRWIACHPYFCAVDGFYGNPQTGGAPIHVIIGGEYETNGSAGISVQQSAHLSIEGNVQMYANGTYDILLSAVTGFTIHDCALYSPAFRHIQMNNCAQGSIHDNTMTGQNSGYMIQISGNGPGVNAEIDIHDNILAASGSSYANALNLSNVAGANIHDNVFEEGVLESGTSDYNVIRDNTFTSPVNGLTTSGAHTRAYRNQGVADYAYSTASAVAAQPDQMYQLNGATATVTLSPPGSGAGATALAGGSVGVTLPATTITLAAAPTGWPASGRALIPVSGGYAVVNYSYITGNVLEGCTGGAGTTAAGSAYICPDPSLRFQAVASSTANAVTIACPPGMTINGGGGALTLTSGHLYTAVLGITSAAANWAIY